MASSSCAAGAGNSTFPWPRALARPSAVISRDYCVARCRRRRVAGSSATSKGCCSWSLVTAGLSGVMWFLLQGSDAALTWRTLHIVLARILIAAGVLHVLAVASHLLDLVRD